MTFRIISQTKFLHRIIQFIKNFSGLIRCSSWFSNTGPPDLLSVEMTTNVESSTLSIEDTAFSIGMVC